jgi:hypothetical protein
MIHICWGWRNSSAVIPAALTNPAANEIIDKAWSQPGIITDVLQTRRQRCGEKQVPIPDIRAVSLRSIDLSGSARVYRAHESDIRHSKIFAAKVAA